MSTTIAIASTRPLSSAASQALAEAAFDEAEARGIGLDFDAVEAVVTELLPYYRAWDARGGFEPNADCAALWAEWERESSEPREGGTAV